MILIGKNLTKSNDSLQMCNIDDVVYEIQNPRKDILDLITKLRIIKSVDKKQYDKLKLQLPYFVCGIFDPHIRNLTNFAYIQYFVIDLDNLSGKGIEINRLKDEITKDDRVVICFISPSEDGLKIIFKLEEKCFDTGMYTAFYKEFCKSLEGIYNICQVVDHKTCDVSRVCFYSVDPNIYFNKSAHTIDINCYINPFIIPHNDTDERSESTHMDKGSSLEEATISEIKRILNLSKPREKHNKEVYVPKILENLMSGLSAFLLEKGLNVEDITNISYGKKIKIRCGHRRAEINLFYGKLGFKAVSSPKRGTDKELNELMVSLIYFYLDNIDRNLL